MDKQPKQQTQHSNEGQERDIEERLKGGFLRSEREGLIQGNQVSEWEHFCSTERKERICRSKRSLFVWEGEGARCAERDAERGRDKRNFATKTRKTRMERNKTEEENMK